MALCPASPSLQWGPGTSVPHLPSSGPEAPSLQYYEPRRRPGAQLGGVRGSLAFPDPLGRASGLVSLARARLVGEADAAAPRRESSPRWSALRGLMWPQGDHWLSHVPESPLWRHAPLFDPGGVLHTRRIASRTAACRSLHTVGFGLDPAEAILLTTTLPISGLHHAACVLVPSSFVRPLLGVHVECTPDLLARRWSGGICPLGCAPTRSQ
jgi:hypothetical protein